MKKTIELLRKDLLEWSRYFTRKSNFVSFCYFFLKYPEFRYLVKIRIKILGAWVAPLRWLLTFSTLHHNLYVYMDENKIGGGVVFHHAFSTIVSASEIGEKCHIFQQVTIGNGRTGIPKLGDNVRVYAGAKIIGGVEIGEDVIVGANAVVTKNIPAHCIVAGAPAKIIKKRKSYDDKWVDLKK